MKYRSTTRNKTTINFQNVCHPNYNISDDTLHQQLSHLIANLSISNSIVATRFTYRKKEMINQ